MGTKLTRRDFISFKTDTTITALRKAPAKDDPFFNKYANKAMPFSSARTQSGLNIFSGDWSDLEISHLLRRITFGAKREDISLLKTKGLIDSVNFLIDNPVLPTSSPINVYENEVHDTQGCPFGASWIEWPGSNDSDPYLNVYRTARSYKQWWIGVLLNQSPHILEKLTLFWANHFSTRMDGFNYCKAIWQHFKKIRLNCLGNFSTLLKEITVDPHMLFFLNGNLNSASAPDENYARELQELFTVGKGTGSGYTEDDVKQAAKILTGWRRQEQADGFYNPVFDDADHDTTDKQFSAFYGNKIIRGRAGQDGQYETDDLLNMILGTDEAAKYICRCLYRWFVYYVIDDAAEQNVIGPLAAIFRNSNYEIKPVLKALFLSEHFFDLVNRGCIIKSPVDFYVGFRREFNVFLPDNYVDEQYAHWTHFKDRLDEGAQDLGDPPNVAGWPAYYQAPVYYQAWINSDTIQRRASVFSNYTTDNGYPVGNSQSAIKIDFLAYAKSFDHPEDPNALINDMTRSLLPQALVTDQYSFMLNILLKEGQTHYWTDAWNAYAANPADDIAKGIVYERLKALIIYITNLEEYQLF